MTERRLVIIRWTGSEWSYRFGQRNLLSNQLLRPRTFDDDLEISLWDYTPRSGDVVVDIGAGTGTEAVPIARLVGETGQVIAVEAHPATTAVLRRCVEINGVSNVVVVEQAMADQPGSVRIGDSSEAGVNSILDNGAIEVTANTVDLLLSSLGVEHVDLLKMNIEGAERLAVLGMSATAVITDRMVISCHDFLGTDWGATKSIVTAWLLDHQFTIETRPNDPRPWCRDYLYATAPRAPARTIEVLHLIAPVAFGGGEALLSDLIASHCEGLTESMATIGHSAALAGHLAAQGTRIWSLGRREVDVRRANKFVELAQSVCLLKELRRLIRELRPDVLHAHGFPASFMAAVSPVGDGERIYTHHYERARPSSIERRALTVMFNRYQALTTPADHLTQQMNSFFPDVKEAFETLHIGIDEGFFSAQPNLMWREALADSTRLAVCVGRLVPSKNQRLIVDALAGIAVPDRPDLMILIVGEGPDEAVLKAAVAEAQLESHIRFVGQLQRDDLPGLLAAADFGVFPSLTEGSSIAGAEMLAAGLPILALDIPAMRETIGVAGLLVAEKNFGAGILDMMRSFARLAPLALAQSAPTRVSNVKRAWHSLYLRTFH